MQVELKSLFEERRAIDNGSGRSRRREVARRPVRAVGIQRLRANPVNHASGGAGEEVVAYGDEGWFNLSTGVV